MLNYRFMILSLGSTRTDFHILACFHTILYTSAEPPFASCVKCLILDSLSLLPPSRESLSALIVGQQQSNCSMKHMGCLSESCEVLMNPQS